MLWKSIKEKYWYLLLLAGSTCFVLKNKDIIIKLEFDKLSSVHLIFILWIILLILPLFSEMELFGIKLTKEFQKATEEVKKELVDLKIQLMQLNVSNSVANSIHVGNIPMPSEEKIEELLEKMTYEEIAVKEKCKHPAVVKSVKAALEKMKKFLNE